MCIRDRSSYSAPAAPKTQPADETQELMAPLWSDGDEPVGGVVADLKQHQQNTKERRAQKLDADEMRANMQSLREVANYSARSALADYAWKRMRAHLALRAILIGLALLAGLASYATYKMEMHTLHWLTLVLFCVAGIGLAELWYAISRVKQLKPETDGTPTDALARASQLSIAAQAPAKKVSAADLPPVKPEATSAEPEPAPAEAQVEELMPEPTAPTEEAPVPATTAADPAFEEVKDA